MRGECSVSKSCASIHARYTYLGRLHISIFTNTAAARSCTGCTPGRMLPIDSHFSNRGILKRLG